MSWCKWWHAAVHRAMSLLYSPVHNAASLHCFLYWALLHRTSRRTRRALSRAHTAAKAQQSPLITIEHAPGETRSSADADNRRDTFSGQSRSTNIVHILGTVSYCAIVTLSFRRALFTIFDFKNVVTLKSGSEVTQCHWKWQHSIDCVWFPISVS